MAPRWSNNGSSWAGASSGGGLNTTVIVAAVAALLVGLLGGFFLGNRGGGTGVTLPGRNANSAIAESSISGMASAENNQAGAVKAATSFLTGFPNLATSPGLNKDQALSEILAPNADPTARTTIEASVATMREQLLGTGTTATGRVVTTPVSYKTVLGTEPQNPSVTVTIWYCSVIVDPTGPKFRSSWATLDITVVHNKQWQVLKFVNRDGPAPDIYSLDGTTGNFEAVKPILNNSYAYRYALAP